MSDTVTLSQAAAKLADGYIRTAEAFYNEAMRHAPGTSMHRLNMSKSDSWYERARKTRGLIQHRR